MAANWVAIEVIDGPQSLQGKIAKVRLEPDLHSRADNNYSDFRNLGRMEFMKMFGDFEGLEKLSRTHIQIRDHLNQGELRIEDQFSTNGTEFPNGNQGKEVIAILAGVLKTKLTWSIENFTITPEDFIVAAPRMSESGYSPPQVLDDDSLMDLITSAIKKVCQETGMSWQLRRNWSVREKPVDQSTISDYQWKIIPKNGIYQYESEKNPLVPGEHHENEIHDGQYYLVFVKNGELFFQHSGHYGGVLGHHFDCYHYVIQSSGWNSFNNTDYYGNGFEISKWLMKWVEIYPPSFYSVT